ncbi:MAG TPA: hypothetical protein VNT27_02875 [Propionibacteriaceae bacterium]|nr:hypothetical protein [Propionibacteriaceae bacterium]
MGVRIGMGQRYARAPIVVQVCADCGVYVADQPAHDGWHDAHPPISDEMFSVLARLSFESAGASGGGWPFPFAMGPSAESNEFGRLLFRVAQDHFDPGHERLEWSEGFTGSGGPGPLKEWGRKFGWAAPQDTGQAMVYVAVGNIPPPDRHPCGQYDNPGPSTCHPESMPDGSEAQVLTNPDRLEVHWPRHDGTYVFAIVDATFRNNSLTPSQAALPTLDQLKAFVMDPRLVLP